MGAHRLRRGHVGVKVACRADCLVKTIKNCNREQRLRTRSLIDCDALPSVAHAGGLSVMMLAKCQRTVSARASKTTEAGPALVPALQADDGRERLERQACSSLAATAL